MSETDGRYSRDPKKQQAGEREVRDDFWAIDRLLPNRGSRAPARRNRTTPSATEIEVPARVASRREGAEEATPVSGAPLTVPPPRRVSQEEAATGVWRNGMMEPLNLSIDAELLGSLPEASKSNAPAVPPEKEKSTPPAASVHYVPPHTPEEEKAPASFEYRPDGVILHRVEVYEWTSSFHYFDQFAKDAAAYARRKPTASAGRVSFFSYFPQYVQMNRRQSAWYLHWREQVRGGKYPDTDYAYVLLYIFELINLDADGETARCYAKLMTSVWMAYRQAYPQLDRYMCEWLCDYCLIHALPAPTDMLAPALDAIIECSRLKEFYLVSAIAPEASKPDGGDGRNLRTARLLMRHCCQYDYRKSKFSQGEHKELFEKTIPAALAAAIPLLLGTEEQPPIITMQDSTVTRDAFTGALCSYRFKRKITVSYTSFSRSHDLRFLIGDMVKHVENRLRTWIGVRSKLSVMSLPIPLRDALDAYLAPLAPQVSPAPAKKKEAPRPAYESLYDLPDKPLSLADAAAIEESSWETTKILTEAFGDNSEFGIRNSELKDEGSASVSRQEEGTPAIPPASAEDAHDISPSTDAIPHSVFRISNSPSSPLAAALGDRLPFLRAALDGDREAQRAHAAASRKMPDAIADEINAITAEVEIFDMVLEDDGSGFYTVIEDYRVILQSI